MNPIYQQMQTSIFERMSGLAAEHNAVNLGQGFPDFGWPEPVLDEAAKALKQGSNQYAPSRGIMPLRRAIASHYRRHFHMDVAPDDVCVTSGATEALGAAILAVVQPGDEVIIFTPAYDSYAPMIRRAGGTPVEIALQPPEWKIDPGALKAAVSERTRAILLNNPHNPTGRLYGADEIEVIARVARDANLTVISDEVWEHILLDGQTFTPLASLPGMAERTIKIGSAGKIFSLTGWKIGWLITSPALAPLVARAHQFLTFSTAPNLQSAVAFGLDQGDEWLQPMRDNFRRSRDLMVDRLNSVGLHSLEASSTYFLCVDLKASGIDADDATFADAAVSRAGVATIPLSAFAEQDPTRHLVRLCFGKKDETIDAGVAAMARARALFT